MTDRSRSHILIRLLGNVWNEVNVYIVSMTGKPIWLSKRQIHSLERKWHLLFSEEHMGGEKNIEKINKYFLTF